MQHVESDVLGFDPFWRRPIVRHGRPHALHLGSEVKSESDRAHRLNFKECQDSRAVGRMTRCKEDFSHCKDGMRKSDGCVVRTHFDHSRLLVHVYRHWIILYFGMNTEIAKNLPRENPSLKRTILCAKKSAPGANHCERIAGNGVS